jgi:GT2 family glycosyltransferase
MDNIDYRDLAKAAVKKRSSILISVLNWNGFESTVDCLRHFSSTAASDWDIVVIDNGSAVDYGSKLKTLYPTVEWLRLEENRGFTGGQNIGMQLAIDRGYEAVLLLNNDCEISSESIRAMMITIRSDPLNAAVSPLIFKTSERNRPQVVSAWFDWDRHTSARPSDPHSERPPTMACMVPGTALLISCSALKQVGLFDDRYFAYYEDNDFSARLATAGLNALYCKNAKAWHDSRPVHRYSELALYLSARNSWLFWRSHTPPKSRAGMFRHLVAQSLYEIAMLKKGGAASKSRAVVAGFWDAQLGKFGKPPTEFQSPRSLRLLMCVAPYLFYQLLSDPLKAVRSRLPF